MDVLLPFTPELLHEPLMVLRDSLEFSGSFMVPVLVKLALQAGQPVVLLAVAQGQVHYQQALRKLGINMAAHMQSGQLTVIETLAQGDLLCEAELAVGAPALVSCLVHAVSAAQSLPADAHAASDDAAASGAAAGSPAEPAAAMQQPQRGANCAQIASECCGGTSAKQQRRRRRPPIAILIDDLTAIGSLIADDEAWRSFLHKLQSLLPPLEQPPPSPDVGTGTHQIGGRGAEGLGSSPVSLTALLHSDVEDAAAALLTWQTASVIIDIEPLTAGQSVDVSGRMRMQLQRCTAAVPWGSFEGDPERRFLVKVSDRGLRFLQQYTAS